jgi:hypothetical protein
MNKNNNNKNNNNKNNNNNNNVGVLPTGVKAEPKPS